MNFAGPHPLSSRLDVPRTVEATRPVLKYKNRILAALSPATYIALQPRLQPIDFEEGDVLHEPGRPGAYGYFVESGIIAHQALMASGRAITVGLIGAEGFVGYSPVLGLGSTSLRLVAQVKTHALRITLEDLKRVAGSSVQVEALLLRSLHLQYMDSAQTAACNSVHEVSGRLSRWILLVHDRMLLGQHAPDGVLPLTHEALSEMLGASRSTVSLSAELLKNTGLISYTRGNIRINDHKALERSACECYEVSRALLNEYLGAPTNHSS
ncbi:MAG TPA: Crp/Fnr family transcriptional regulator [Terriglobales bacterium]|nr:Crp/Fnr family transcriptional regulator [Terriglobales bacterium]